MGYSIKNNHIILAKISGGSPCEAGLKVEYQYEVVGDNFVINFTLHDKNFQNLLKVLSVRVL